ncbi:MAG: PAS domain S-box protein [Acidobacteria bacterium]|nr:PAS domain S-box protein [Acidobacteriota bacterium]
MVTYKKLGNIIIGVAFLFILNILCLAEMKDIQVGIFEYETLCRPPGPSSPGKAGGFFVDILEYIAAKEGWRIHYRAASLPELMERMARGEIDLVPAVSHSHENEEKFYFTRETVISTWAQVYTLEPNSLQSLIQLDKRAVGVVKDDPYNQDLRRIIKGFDIKVTIMEFCNPGEVFQAIKEKWIDGGVVDRLYAVHREISAGVKQTPVIFSPVELRFASAKGRSDIIDTLDYHLIRLKNNPGSPYYRLMDQIMGEKKTSSIPGFIFWSLITTIGLLLLFISASFLLHRQVEIKTKELSQKNQELQTKIRERECAEQALIESEEKFRLISEESLMAIAIIQDDVIQYFNQAFSILTEYTMEEIMKWKAGDYAHLLYPDDRNFVVEQSRKKQQGKTDVINRYSYRFISKSGKMKWVENYSRTILFKNEYAVLLTAVEITETIENREKLAAEKERLAVTLRSIGDGVITTDKKGNIILVNRMAETITGWKQDEVQGQKITQVFRVKDTKTGWFSDNLVQNAIESGKMSEVQNDIILIARDGGERIILSNCTPICDKDQQIMGAVLVFHDITEKRVMEMEIQKAVKLESLGVLAAGIAHDFNNLLAILIGNISLAKHSIDIKDPVYKILDDAEKGAYSATGLSRQLLTFARGNAPIKETASIREIIEDSTQFALRGSAVRYDCHFDPGLFSADVDKSQLSQVFQNLIINAEQAMPNGGVITIRAGNLDNSDRDTIFLPPGKYIQIILQDQGVGIPHDNLEKIFDPFFTTKQKGNGLGLSMVYSIIKKHGGHIRVESQVGKGTTFSIFLPASSQEITQVVKQNKAIIKGTGHILVMDDNELILDMLESMLEKFGYSCSLARNGEEAIEFYQRAYQNEKPYAAVIMDLTISGGMGGKEAINRLKKIDREVKALVFSGYANDPVVANYRDFGFKGVINKPFRMEELTQVLHHVISDHL